MSLTAKNRRHCLKLAEQILDGKDIDPGTYRSLLDIPDAAVLSLCAGADLLREHHFGRTVHLCVICNGKSGRCSEDCSFCAQSAHSRTGITEYPLMSEADLAETGRRLEDSPVNRYSIVTSGKKLSHDEISRVAAALASLDTGRLGTCASLGILAEEELELLRQAGVSTYHHNLETAASLFQQVCTTHTYADRVATVQAARAAGLRVCCGGIFGLGESHDQICELAFALKELAVAAVPVNFLVPIAGTPAAGRSSLTPMKCWKIIAVMRYVLPDKEIIVCGGREHNLGALHPLVFYAGASGVMTGDYLTTRGRTLTDDLALLESLEMSPRPR